jgi:hypothetical protein
VDGVEIPGFGDPCKIVLAYSVLSVTSSGS